MFCNRGEIKEGTVDEKREEEKRGLKSSRYFIHFGTPPLKHFTQNCFQGVKNIWNYLHETFFNPANALM